MGTTLLVEDPTLVKTLDPSRAVPFQGQGVGYATCLCGIVFEIKVALVAFSSEGHQLPEQDVAYWAVVRLRTVGTNRGPPNGNEQ